MNSLTKEAAGQAWPFDKPNGWDRDVVRLLALIQKYPMMWLCLHRAKYLELRIDTRDCGFGLRDRDGKPLSPDEIVKAIEDLKAQFGDDGDVASREYREGSRPDEPLLDELARLRQDKADAEADALRLHGDKMAFYEAALSLVHSETIKNVCGWYSEIEAFRKLLGMAADNQQTTEEK